MAKRESTIKPLVEIRSGDYRAIAFKVMDFEGSDSLMISIEDGGPGASFFFDDAREAQLFAKRVIDAAEAYNG